MARNLDLTALRSFVAVADTGGVTKAAGFLNLTQSAVSMQLKRLEEGLGLTLLDRSARTVSLTANGEQLLSYARRMLELNDEVYARLTAQEYEGVIRLGVPHDVVYPAIPQVLQQFSANFPRMKVQLESSYTVALKECFARGECDVILTTEDDCGHGGETLAELPLVWIGAQNGAAWRQRPLRLAFEHRCIFRKGVLSALDEAGIPWEMAVESDMTRTIEASVSADLAVHVLFEGSQPPFCEAISHNGALPALQHKKINLYASAVPANAAVSNLKDLIRNAFSRRLATRHAAE
ncbi:HTH-type transcriptional regulator YofA [Aquimixticola soesokkakensis]|uniref:HTH-type transcriptional regulator YofA n=1 Tax=Aquimixticola soesokkakensis TaxID=1519096 RepID=A0A1Y5TED5_9RHOB|nr:LysR family transcriptional regulator [Aquimixticola soesokkakensis]SLN58476.1 HTH-type transcriptional regulator YofA [Aquimixticola soesokkakensis]